jgi:hypothetical protein
MGGQREAPPGISALGCGRSITTHAELHGKGNRNAAMRRLDYGVTVTFTIAVVQQQISPPPPSPE